MIVPIRQEMSAPESHQLRPGVNVEAIFNHTGASLSALGGGSNFNHPFRPLFGARTISFVAGTVRSVNGIGPIIPTILVGGQQVPMNGTNGNNPPQLALDPAKQNANGESYAVLQVSPDPKSGELIKGSACEIIHDSQATNVDPVTGATVASLDPATGRCALALILWSGNSPVQVLPIIFFNLVYERVTPPAGGGAPMHIFY